MVQYYLWFQLSTEGPGMYPPWIRGTTVYVMQKSVD